ncbi:MAG: hypothetical protein ACUVVU_00310 [Tepidimonas sp.]|uniref:hypothetical protein n=1 Tax=Tepidimonas sp. TaxID=2002775 RepID=UPI0040550BB8
MCILVPLVTPLAPALGPALAATPAGGADPSGHAAAADQKLAGAAKTSFMHKCVRVVVGHTRP